MGIFDRRKERDKEKNESPEWMQAYMPSYSFVTDSAGNPAASFALSEGVSTRLLKKPHDFYEETENFVLILISSTEKKVIGELPYEKAMKVLEKFQIDETKEEMLIRALSYTEMKEVLDAKK